MNAKELRKQIEDYEVEVEGRPPKRWHGPAPKQTPDFREGGMVSSGALARVGDFEVRMPSIADARIQFEMNQYLNNISKMMTPPIHMRIKAEDLKGIID